MAFGFIQMCADKRFHRQVMEAFEKATGLKSHEYWIEATAGGAPAISLALTADYAHHHGASVMGWAAHGDNCGGYPSVTTEEIEKKLDEAIKDRKVRYPDAQHFRIFSTEEETIIEKV